MNTFHSDLPHYLKGDIGPAGRAALSTWATGEVLSKLDEVEALLKDANLNEVRARLFSLVTRLTD
jgi:hypothetical protein